MSVVTLDGFCHGLMNGGAPVGRLHPAEVAREFVDFLGLSAFPDMDEIKTLLERAGVATVVLSHDTGGLRGYHTGTKDGVYEIVIDASESESTQEYTALHEAYEIVRERLRDLYPLPARRSPRGKEEVPPGRPVRRRRPDAALLVLPVRRGVRVRCGGPAEDVRARLLVSDHQAGRGDAAPAASRGPVRARGRERPARVGGRLPTGGLQGQGGGPDSGVQAKDSQKAAVPIFGGCCRAGAVRPPRGLWPRGSSSRAGRSTWKG